MPMLVVEAPMDSLLLREKQSYLLDWIPHEHKSSSSRQDVEIYTPEYLDELIPRNFTPLQSP